MKYLPFLDGKYSVAPGLVPKEKLNDDQDTFFFQIDNHYHEWIDNKKACRSEGMAKYFCHHHAGHATIAAVNKFIISKLLEQHPEKFSLSNTSDLYTLTNHLLREKIEWSHDYLNIVGDKYLSLFDALCSQLQEDFAICQLEETTDSMVAIHLCSPNHWAAGDKIGKTFDVVHAPVPGIERTLNNYTRMLQSVVEKGPYTRFAWGIATDKRLNHHPDPPAGVAADVWRGRDLDGDTKELYVRVERQNLIGMPLENAFLFTIRTYFYDVDVLSPVEKSALLSSVESMSEASLRYKGLLNRVDALKKKLQIRV